MLSHLATAGSHLPITLLHADVDEESFALRRQVLDDIRFLPAASAHVWFERGGESTLPADVHTGQMNLEDIKLPDDATYYLCGPLPFMQAVRSALVDRGVAARDIQYEVFGPDLWQADLVTEETPGANDRGRHAAG
jgi:nitric oxide dioxygenase